MADIPVEVWQLVQDEEERKSILLRDAEGRLLQIVIGDCEAAAIWVRLAQELAAPYVRRPWSHDLIHTLLERMDAELERVVIDGFANDTFYATLHIRYRGEELVIDARPSDAIALLLRMHAPLFVNEEVLLEEGFHPEWEEPDEDDAEYWEDEP